MVWLVACLAVCTTYDAWRDPWGDSEDGDADGDAGSKDATTCLNLGDGHGMFLQHLGVSSRQIANFTVYYF